MPLARCSIGPLVVALGVALAGCRPSPPQSREREAAAPTAAPSIEASAPASDAATSSFEPRERRPWVELYYPGWTMAARPAGALDLSNVSDLVLFGLVPEGRRADATPTGLDEQRVGSARAAARASGASVLVCVGGERTGERFRDAIGSDGAALAASVSAFVARHDLDGVVLDIEPLSAVGEAPLVAFVTVLRDRLLASIPRARVEAVVAPDEREIARLAPIAGLLDRVAVMSYLGRPSDDEERLLVEKIAALGIPRASIGLGIDARTPEDRSRRRAALVRDGRAGGLILWHAGSSCERGDSGARCAFAAASLVRRDR